MVAATRALGLVCLLMLNACAATESVFGSETVKPPQALLAFAGPVAEPVGGTDHGAAVMRASDGLFYVDAVVNGADVRFVVDSGSSLVVLSKDDAARAGLRGDDGGTLMQTAGGVTRMRHTTIATLKFADRTLSGVEAAVVDDLPGVSLMGQSALARFELVAFRRDRLQLR